MQLFKCSNCEQLLYFENTRCVKCNSSLGYVAGEAALLPIETDEAGLWNELGVTGHSFRRCANSEIISCNWLIPELDAEPYCEACRLNSVIPDLSVADNLQRWQRLEQAKHHLIHTLLQLGLPVVSRTIDPQYGLGFVFVADADEPSEAGVPTFTGHLKGIITINIAEADDAERERQRKAVGEPYRTLLGHFRHEIGHYYWDRLIGGLPIQDQFRKIFGDDSVDYGEQLKAHYENGPAAQWQDHFVSAYASAHPLEDFAETWAHYLHILDTLETAHAFGMVVQPGMAPIPSMTMSANFDPYCEPDFSRVVRAWLPLTFAVNSLNRSMGHSDLYPFVITPGIEEKLAFVHALVRSFANKPADSGALGHVDGDADGVPPAAQ